MSLYILVLLGGQAIGGPLMGVIVETFCTHAAMVVSGGVPAVAAAVTAIALARRGQLTLQVRTRWHVPVVSMEQR